MRVLLDECVPRRLRTQLAGHDVRTVPEASWAGIKSGRLLAAAAAAEFACFITVDRNLQFQLQDFLVGDRLISLVGDHLTGSLAEPKATILTRRSSCWQVFVL